MPRSSKRLYVTDAPKKLFIRFSNASDHDNLMEFYELNAHKNVRKREQALMKQLIEDGAVVLIEDAGGQIVAASMTYPHKTIDKGGVERVQWQEVGTTRIVLNGYPGLFDAMITMQTLRAFLVEPPESTFVAQMHTAPVQGMAEALGWRRMSVMPQDLMDAKIRSVDPADAANVNANNWYVCGLEALPTMATRMVKSIDDPILENKKTGERIELDYSRSTFFKLFGPEIRVLANKTYGDVEKPDEQQNVRQRRDKWLKNFFR